MHPAKLVLLATILLAGTIVLFQEGLGLLGVGLIAAFLLTAKHKR